MIAEEIRNALALFEVCLSGSCFNVSGFLADGVQEGSADYSGLQRHSPFRFPG
jgi:hypothetical protein